MSAVNSRGFSLVELMVAMTLSLILLAGVLSVTYSSKVTYYENERVARLQENGRTAIDLMLRDMRAGGFHGCARTVPFTNTLNASNTLLWDFGAPVEGFESTGTGTWSPALDALITSPRDGSDVIAIRTARAGRPVFTTNAPMASTNSSITVDRNSSADKLLPGDTVLISDCSAATVFAVSDFTGAGSTATVGHGTGGAGPGNATDDLGSFFQTGAQVVPVDTIIYYIRDSGTDRNGVHNPALWRIVGAGGPEELIEGIEALQIQYGVDTDGDLLVNTYVTADAVTNWSSVISVSLAMLIRSVEPNMPQNDTRVYTLLGTDFGPYNDRYQRTLYTTTVTLRNNTT